MTETFRSRAARVRFWPLAVVSLAACHGAVPVVLPPAPPVLPPVVRTLDGAYHGTATRYRADRRTCPPPGLVHFEVVDGRFLYSLGRRGAVPVTIAPDRSLSGSDGDFTVTGRADAARIRGHVDSSVCGYEFGAVRKK